MTVVSLPIRSVNKCETHQPQEERKMKTKLMKTMANAIVIPAALAIATLTLQAQELDRSVNLDAGAVVSEVDHILDNGVIEQSADVPLDTKATEADLISVDALVNYKIDQFDSPVDYVPVDATLDLADQSFDGEQIQAIDALDVARIINY
jgi:hypothetical protein